ncbi:MAG: hypothetical protein ABSH01_22560, partial [Terriglobia bacterium]
TLHCAPHDAQRKTRGRVDRYSFLVRIFHSLLPAGLSRRFPDLRLLQVCGFQRFTAGKAADFAKHEVCATRRA